MFSTISRKKALKLYPFLPQWEGETETLVYPDVSEHFVVTVPSKTIKGHISDLAAKLEKVFRQMGWAEMIFLGDSEHAYLKQENDYKYAKEAFEYFLGMELGRKFNGAMLVSGSELLSTLKHIAWLTGCNAVFPTVYITDKQQAALWNICQYGNVHVDILGKASVVQIKKILQQNDFELVEGSCIEKFSKQHRIKGRVTIP